MEEEQAEIAAMLAALEDLTERERAAFRAFLDALSTRPGTQGQPDAPQA
jgi:predicted RNA polymerase sigma factor